MKLKKFYILAFSFIVLIICFSPKIFALENEDKNQNNDKIETNYVTINTLTDFRQMENLLNTKEIEIFLENAARKTLDLQSIVINHDKRNVVISFYISLKDGDIESLCNTNLLNFFKNIKDFSYYDFSFEIYAKSTDKNFREIEEKVANYIFYRDTINNFDFNENKYIKIIDYADKIWTSLNGEEVIKKELFIDNFKLKIIEIFKYYIAHKIKN